MQRTLAWATIWFSAAAAILSGSAAAQSSRDTLNQARIEPQVGRRLPIDASFVDHRGQQVTIGDVAVGERPTILCLVYFQCPMLCKLAANELVRTVASMDENVGDSFNIAIVSFDPADSPAQADAARARALSNYARDETGRGWFFLTGPPSSIDALTNAIGYHYVRDEQTGQFAHAAGLVIVAPDGVITEYLDGVRFTPSELRASLERARRGETSDRETVAFARCYLYDPTTGKLGFAVQWTIRVLGVLTVMAIGVGVFRLTRGDSTR